MTIHILVLGWKQVGKTNLIKKVMNITPNNEYISTKEIEIHNYKDVIFYEVPYEKMKEIELLESDGIIIVFDVNQMKSIEIVDEIRREYKEKMILLIGNHSKNIEEYIKEYKYYGYLNGYQKEGIEIFIKSIIDSKQEVFEKLNENTLDIEEMNEFIQELKQDKKEFEEIRDNYIELKEHALFRLFNEKKRDYILNKMDKMNRILYYKNIEYSNSILWNQNGFYFQNISKKLN